MQPDLDDLFFLGNEYEEAFDRFEVMLALTHADLLYQKKQYIWGPIGRFGWKSSLHGETKNPLSGIMAEAKAMSSSWPPLKAGFSEVVLKGLILLLQSMRQWLKS